MAGPCEEPRSLSGKMPRKVPETAIESRDASLGLGFSTRPFRMKEEDGVEDEASYWDLYPGEDGAWIVEL